MRAIRFTEFGGASVLRVEDVQMPEPRPDEVRVRVLAAGANTGEIFIREGYLEQMFPTTFPCGQGTDFAGRVDAVGSAVKAYSVGDEVIGYSDHRSAQADYVVVDEAHLIMKPRALDWIRAGALNVAGVTATVGVRAIAAKAGLVVAVSGAAGAVGFLAVQLARRAGARVLGIASEASFDRLRSVGVEPLSYGDGLAERLRATAPDGIDGFLDCFGGGYVDIAHDLGVPLDHINTIMDFEAAGRLGVRTEGAMSAEGTASLIRIASLIASGEIVMPIAAIYPLERVREAYDVLGLRHTHGKIVFDMSMPADAPPVRADS